MVLDTGYPSTYKAPRVQHSFRKKKRGKTPGLEEIQRTGLAVGYAWAVFGVFMNCQGSLRRGGGDERH